MMINIDKDTFIKYEQVRLSNEYNMVTEWQKVKEIINITPDEYWEIVDNYSILKAKFSINGEIHIQGLNRDVTNKNK